MTDKIDELINETLSKEDDALLERYNNEPGYLKQAFGMFHGPLAWVMWFVSIAQLLIFLGAIYCVWTLFTTNDLITGVRWGVIAVILVQITTFLRGFMGSHLEANRVLRELKQLELRVVRMEHRPN